jgi:flagellar biosynthesis protein FlhB
VSESSGDKKHSATERRRRQAREEGQVVKSQDLASAALLLAAVGALSMFGGDAAEEVASILIDALSPSELKPVESQDLTNDLLRMASRLAMACVPIMLSMFVAGIAVNVGQTGILFTANAITPKVSNISPMSGLKRILSLQGIVRLGFGMVKVCIIGWVAYATLADDMSAILNMSALEVPQIASLLCKTVMGTTFWIGLALFVLAFLEYGFQRWKREQDMMMTDQEMRDEMKESEGDPQMAARRRQIQRQMMMQRADSEVPKADVVVSNPTELAIAIQYDPTSMPAPIVLAKGAGVMAQKIRRIALQNGVPVVERKPLAQALYKSVDVGQTIPPDQYQAVAEVLRYVYQLKGKKIPKATAA